MVADQAHVASSHVKYPNLVEHVPISGIEEFPPQMKTSRIPHNISTDRKYPSQRMRLLCLLNRDGKNSWRRMCSARSFPYGRTAILVPRNFCHTDSKWNELASSVLSDRAPTVSAAFQTVDLERDSMQRSWLNAVENERKIDQREFSLRHQKSPPLEPLRNLSDRILTTPLAAKTRLTRYS